MFGGFKATMNLFGGRKNKKDLHSELTPDMCVSGAYRTSKDIYFGYIDPPKNPPSEQVFPPVRPTKSTNDLTKPRVILPNVRNSISEISRDPRGAEQTDLRNGTQSQNTKNQEREQRRLEKQRLVDQKARDKQAAQDQLKQEKLLKEQQKKEAQQDKAKRDRRPGKKKPAPQPQPAKVTQTPNPIPQAPVPYSTNTLESSISRSSGPPPYSDVPKLEEINFPVPSTSSSNVMYSKPVDTGSWDMISQHRQQVIRPTTNVGAGVKPGKTMVMDLNYNFGATSQTTENSDA